MQFFHFISIAHPESDHLKSSTHYNTLQGSIQKAEELSAFLEEAFNTSLNRENDIKERELEKERKKLEKEEDEKRKKEEELNRINEMWKKDQEAIAEAKVWHLFGMIFQH